MNSGIKVDESHLANLPLTPPGVYLGSAMMPTILVCDDEPELIDILTSMLKYNYPSLNIVSALDGVEALEKVREYRPHVILTDLKMPNLNGIEFVIEIRNRKLDIPVIFISSFADRDRLMDFIQLGVVDFHDKPIIPEKLSFSVANALRIAQLREGVQRLGKLNIQAHDLLARPELKPSEYLDERTMKAVQILDEASHLSSFILGL